MFRRSAAAARICGWLDGRTLRTLDDNVRLVAVMAAAEASIGDRWQQLAADGRGMTIDQLVEHDPYGARHHLLICRSVL